MSAPVSRYPKLRTKKGCIGCRDRRKKCEEQKLSCASCDRLSLNCRWPDLASLQDRRERGAENSRWSRGSKSPKSEPPCSEMPGTTQQNSTVQPVPFLYETFSQGIISLAQTFLRSDREVVLMTFYFESFVPANILPKAHSNFSKINAGDVQELKDSMFACSSIQLANKNEIPPVEALSYYARAVSGLRRRLDTGNITGLEDWLLAVTILLHCFEVSSLLRDTLAKTGAKIIVKTWRCDSDQIVPLAFEHLVGAIQLLKLRCTTNLPIEEHDLSVLMAESVVFHVSTLLAFDSSAGMHNVDNNLWEWIEVILDRPTLTNAIAPANHPVLGTPRKLNKLIFEISRLSLRLPLTAEDILERQRLSVELSIWETTENENYSNSKNYMRKDPYMDVRQLYIICARIILLCVENSEVAVDATTHQNKVRRYRSQGMAVLNTIRDTDDEPWNFMMRWPLRVLGAVIEGDSDRNVIQESLQRIWERSSCGEVKRSLEKMRYTPIWAGDILQTNESRSL